MRQLALAHPTDPLWWPEGGADVAALFVEAGGAYYGVPGVATWPAARDAREYPGPCPVVAHPPCERWGRLWHACRPNTRHRKGEDGGCFAAALGAVRRWGGVLEHPAGSAAWRAHGLAHPPPAGGWVAADADGGWTCRVEQGHYGHLARKATWLYANGAQPAELRWGPSAARMVVTTGRRDRDAPEMPKRLRSVTPPEFRAVLLAIARASRK